MTRATQINHVSLIVDEHEVAPDRGGSTYLPVMA